MIKDLIKYFGGQTKTGKALGCSQSLVSRWLNNGADMPSHFALKAEKLTGGKFRAMDLCPALAEIEAMEVPVSPNLTQNDKTPSGN